MKTVTITEAKRGLKGLIADQEPVNVTVHGQPIGTLRVIAIPKVDRERAREAAQWLADLSKRRKPNSRDGGARAIRALRDDGE